MGPCQPTACSLPFVCVTYIAIWVIWSKRFGVQHTSSVITRQADSASLAANDAYGKLPLSFEANRGQADGQIMFLSRGSSHSLFLTATEAIFRMRIADCGLRIADREWKIDDRADRSSILVPRSSILDPKSWNFNPRSSILELQSSILDPRYSISNPPSALV